MTGRLSGKVCIITGATGHLGAAMVRAFRTEGAEVLATDIPARQEAGEALTQETGCLFAAQDVTIEAEWAGTIAAVHARFGRVDVLVNNAGIAGDPDAGSPADQSVEDFDHVLRVNVRGLWLGIKHALPAMMERKAGSIVNLASLAALIGTPFATAYGASKAAVSQMTKTTALFAATSGVRCNAVAPGQIDSPMLRGLFEHTARKEGVAPEAIETVFRGRIPGGHLGTARDVAMAALYLASDEASFINGTTLSVDGGESVQ